MEFNVNSNHKLEQELLESAKAQLKHDIETCEELTQSEAQAVSGGLNKVHIASLHADEWDTVIDPPVNNLSSGFLGLIPRL